MQSLGEKKEERRTIDAYICQDLHVIITKVVAEDGKVPPTITCPTCRQIARSQGFFVNQNFKPTVEWYKPTDADFKVLSLNMETPEYNRLKEMVIKGMLMSRLVVEEKKDGE